MAKCRKLATLTLWNCNGMTHTVIDVPSLETLTIHAESLAFGNVCNLKSIVVRLHPLGKWRTFETVDAFNHLASLRQLQCIEFRCGFFKVLTAASIKRPLPIAFNHLNKLTLGWVDLSAPDTVHNIFDMVDCCPYMKELVISVYSGKNKNRQKLDYTRFHKSPHLVEVEIRGICGSGV